MNTTQKSHASRHRCDALAAMIVLAILIAAGSCKKHEPNDSHEHATPAAKPNSHAGHDHGPDGGGAEPHTDEVTLTAEAIARYGITVQPAQRQVLRPTLVAPARVAFNTEAMAHVGSPLRGRAVEIPVHVGDTVKRGDALIVVESPELGEVQNAYFQQRIALQAAGPAVEHAKVSWERARGLHEQSQGIALTEVHRREAEYKAATAALRSAEAAVVGSENRLHLLGMSQAAVEELAKTGEIAPHYTIHAPMDGQVVQREITLGELVSPDREALMVLADTSTLWVLADVPEVRLHEVVVGSQAWVTVGAGAGRRFEGKVAFVPPFVDAATRTAQVRIEVPAAALTLKPGMFAQVEIVATDPGEPEPQPVVVVLEAAIQTVEGSPAVFVPVPGEANTFAKRAVTVGPVVGGLVPVLAGLAEGEACVVSGTFILKAELGKGGAGHDH